MPDGRPQRHRDEGHARQAREPFGNVVVHGGQHDQGQDADGIVGAVFEVDQFAQANPGVIPPGWVSEVKGIVETAVFDMITNFFEENPGAAKTIISKALIAARARKAAP